MTEDGDPRTVDVLDHALRQTELGSGTRRWLLERVAVGAAGLGAAGALLPAGDALARERRRPIPDFGSVAVTTEALTVTLLTELLRRVNEHSDVPAAVKAVFEGAYAAEVDHYRFTRQHWRPTTTRFWIPDGFFGGAGNTVDLTAVGKALVAGETLFVNLYLIGVTAFAHAGQATFARFCAELAGCESEHRVLAQTLIGATPPNDVGFEVFSIRRPAGIEQALEHAGVGFGVQGATPGAFYSLPHPIMAPPLQIGSNRPN